MVLEKNTQSISPKLRVQLLFTQYTYISITLKVLKIPASQNPLRCLQPHNRSQPWLYALPQECGSGGVYDINAIDRPPDIPLRGVCRQQCSECYALILILQPINQHNVQHMHRHRLLILLTFDGRMSCRRQWQCQIGVGLSLNDILNQNILARFSHIWTTTIRLHRNKFMTYKQIIHHHSNTTTPFWRPCDNEDATPATPIDR